MARTAVWNETCGIELLQKNEQPPHTKIVYLNKELDKMMKFSEKQIHIFHPWKEKRMYQRGVLSSLI